MEKYRVKYRISDVKSNKEWLENISNRIKKRDQCFDLFNKEKRRKEKG